MNPYHDSDPQVNLMLDLIRQPFVLGTALWLATPPADVSTTPPVPARARAIDLAICLDTSGSMDGLIDSARQGIWAIVNDLALAKPTPKLRVALLSYGNDGHSKDAGWVAVETGFTEDLDLVSQKLFALRTNGGTELVGRVLHASLDQLEWAPAQDAMKLIVVAGNESADQDQEVSFRSTCKRAIERGIMVDAIYCGNPNDGIAPGWREVAQLADGQFHAIDKDHGNVTVETPFDAQLQALSAQLNQTYLPFGTDGARGWLNQTAQDKNAEGVGGAVVAQRAACKAGVNYCNSAWDLVDACRNQTVKLAELPAEQLPQVMRTMSLEERQKHVDTLQSQRAAVQGKIQELTKKRDAAVAEELKKRALDPTKSFDYAVRKAVRAQARARGLEIAEPETTGPQAPATVTPETGADGAKGQKGC
ncbi:MAG: VWA domain-containing protein [Planctomycetota bacterium]